MQVVRHRISLWWLLALAGPALFLAPARARAEAVDAPESRGTLSEAEPVRTSVARYEPDGDEREWQGPAEAADPAFDDEASFQGPGRGEGDALGPDTAVF